MLNTKKTLISNGLRLLTLFGAISNGYLTRRMLIATYAKLAMAIKLVSAQLSIILSAITEQNMISINNQHWFCEVLNIMATVMKKNSSDSLDFYFVGLFVTNKLLILLMMTIFVL